jgi:hypothetical protein
LLNSCPPWFGGCGDVFRSILINTIIMVKSKSKRYYYTLTLRVSRSQRKNPLSMEQQGSNKMPRLSRMKDSASRCRRISRLVPVIHSRVALTTKKTAFSPMVSNLFFSRRWSWRPTVSFSRTWEWPKQKRKDANTFRTGYWQA